MCVFVEREREKREWINEERERENNDEKNYEQIQKTNRSTLSFIEIERILRVSQQIYYSQQAVNTQNINNK